MDINELDKMLERIVKYDLRIKKINISYEKILETVKPKIEIDFFK